MKKSELATIIREEFLTLVSEATEEEVKLEKEKLDLLKQQADVKAKAGLEEEMDDDEMDKAATKGVKGKDAKGVAAQHTSGLKAQNKRDALKKFMDKMKDAGVISDTNKVLDAGKYKEEFAKFKASL